MNAEDIHVDVPTNGVGHANGNGHGMNGHGGNGNGNGVTPGPSASPGPSSSSSSQPSLVNKPTFLESPSGLRFLICDAPNDHNVQSYIDVFRRKNVVVLSRVCDPTYSAGPLLANGIKVVEIPFPDGDPPPPAVVDKWLALVDQVFKNQGQQAKGGSTHATSTGIELNLDGVAKPAIAIHCVAGLGRAPVMVAIALVENGMDPFDAIAFIRKKRRGAINARQLKYIENYQRKSGPKGCCVMQ
jgi:protein tyrosine phosphatase type 4A